MLRSFKENFNISLRKVNVEKQVGTKDNSEDKKRARNTCKQT